MSPLLVVGGGPVGLVTALYARLAGLEVVVLDRAHPAIDKGCGEGLMPGGVALLQELGVELDPDGVHTFRGVHYFDDGAEAVGTFPDGPGLGIRRLHLHRALVARAEAMGVDLRWGVEVQGLTASGLQTSAGAIDGALVVGADGLHSRVRAWIGSDGGPGPLQRFGVRRHYALAPWTDLVEVHWGELCEAYVTPAGPGRVGIAMLWSGGKARFDTLLARFPALAARLGGAPFDSTPRGAGPLHQRVRDVVDTGAGHPPVALVGDASGYLDAITGEGLTLGFHEARSLVDAWRADDLPRYRRAHRSLVRAPFAMIHLLLWLERRPRLRRRVVAALGREPALFGRLLAVNDGALQPWQVGLVPGARLLGRVALGG